MDLSSTVHSGEILRHWDRFVEKVRRVSTGTIDGHQLDIATVVAVARYSAPVCLDKGTLNSIRANAHALTTRLRDGGIIYGVNTGFGGSADTRTHQVEELQRTLIRELHCGILEAPTGEQETSVAFDGSMNNDNQIMSRKRKRESSAQLNGHVSKKRYEERDDSIGYTEKGGPRDVEYLLQNGLPVDQLNNCMPAAWTRASILVRVNSLASACSGVRETLITTMTDLLKHDILPRIPLRGSISASGDLMPLSYIAGTLLGKPTLTVSAKAKDTHDRYITTADVALSKASITPIKLGPKEGLAIVNGTAVSTAVGALAIHDAHGLAVLSQILTAMSVEGLSGTSESFDPFFAKVRPHPGQMDASRNIYSFLFGSQLVQNPDGSEEGSLRQDRYSIRTASQWLGPVLEDLLLAHQQISIECNSVTDNPLVDGSRMLHGGNFQARAITSAMEKTRLGLQTIGRMLFTQCTELFNPMTNRGLPPNLVADEPSASWFMKSVDVMIAALQSELGFLANPVGTHVQTAEMGNQALNSLALISARYCHTALDVLSQLAAAHLFAACQAVDLRAMHIKFSEAFQPQLRTITEEIIQPVLKDPAALESLLSALVSKLDKKLEQASSMDTNQRFISVSTNLQPVVLRFITSSAKSISALEAWTDSCAESMLQTFEVTRDLYSKRPDAKPFLGHASRRIYSFVRDRLSVPFIREYHLRSPDPEPVNGFEGNNSEPNMSLNYDNMTTGSYITRIYTAIRDGSLYVPAMECLRQAQQTAQQVTSIKNQENVVSKPSKVVDSLVSESRIAV